MANKKITVGLWIIIVFLGINAISPLFMLFQPEMIAKVMTIISFVVYAPITIGVYKLKKTARTAAVVVASIVIVYQVLSFIIDISNGLYDIDNFSRFIPIIINSLIIWYLSKQDTKKLFN
jgi:hypothetical protein